MKKLNVSVVLALSVLGAGCSDRKEEFLDGYAVAEVVDMTDKNYEPHNHFEYISGHTSRNTSEAITFLQNQLKKRSESSEAIANVYETKSGSVQCVIVQRADLSKTVMTHELGHCFNLIYFDKLRKKNPSALATIIQNKTSSRYLIESFAEVASSTIAYGIDGDKSQLEARIEKFTVNRNELTKKEYEDLKPYISTVPLLRKLSEFLDTAELPVTHVEQVEFILDKFYLNPEFHRFI